MESTLPWVLAAAMSGWLIGLGAAAQVAGFVLLWLETRETYSRIETYLIGPARFGGGRSFRPWCFLVGSSLVVPNR